MTSAEIHLCVHSNIFAVISQTLNKKMLQKQLQKFTRSQNGLGWRGPEGVIWSKLPVQAGPSWSTWHRIVSRHLLNINSEGEIPQPPCCLPGNLFQLQRLEQQGIIKKLLHNKDVLPHFQVELSVYQFLPWSSNSAVGMPRISELYIFYF